MYYDKIALAALAAGLAATLFSMSHPGWNAEAREAVRHTFAKDTILDVDDINGTIAVTGDGGNTIRVEGEEILRAADQQELERAKKEVQLDMNEKDGIAQLYVNGPFRYHGESGDYHGFHSHSGDPRYEVAYNLNIHVPRGTELRLRDLNGELKTEQTSGKFDLHSVNGAITMNAAAGSGSAVTVNGRIDVSFREAPKAASEFRSVNGPIDAAFPASLAADLRLRTRNGQAFTDFETAFIPQPDAAGRVNGKFSYRSNRERSVRIGAGGPELNFQTTNGDIHIRKETAQ